MAISISSRPNTWSAVKNPVVYKFSLTGGHTNHRVEVEVFKSSDSSSLTGGVKFSFSPDSAGVAYADVSVIIKAYLALEWIKPSALNEIESDTYLKFYIKYQELYDGSATSVVDDVANPRYGVFAALQILKSKEPLINGNEFGNSLITFVPATSSRHFLTLLDYPKLWRGYPSTLSFIFPDGLALLIRRNQYNAAGTLIDQRQQALNTASDDSVNRIDLLNGITLKDESEKLLIKLGTELLGSQVLSNPNFDTSLSPWVNVAGVDQDWVWDSGAMAKVPFIIGETSSDVLRQDFTQWGTGLYRITFNAATADVVQTLTCKVYLSSTFVATLFTEALPAGTVVGTGWSYDVFIPGPFNRIEFVVTQLEWGTAKDFYLTSVSLKTLSVTPYTEDLTFQVADPCDNPIMLFWKNSVGGDAFWLFEHSQEVSYNFAGPKKAKRMTLFAEHLTIDQWEALNELNTLGEVYKENIVEFTSSVNKSHKRDGAQVYVVDTDGKKTGVIVIPTNNVINTKDETHSIEIEIEYPERIE